MSLIAHRQTDNARCPPAIKCGLILWTCESVVHTTLMEFKLCEFDGKPDKRSRQRECGKYQQSAIEGLKCIASRRKVDGALAQRSISVDRRTLQRLSCTMHVARPETSGAGRIAALLLACVTATDMACLSALAVAQP